MPLNTMEGYGEFTRTDEQLNREILYSANDMIKKGGIVRKGEGVLLTGTVMAIDPGTGKLVAYDNAAAANEVQTATEGTAITTGTYTLTYDGQTTAPIAYNATAATVQAALEALSNVAEGDIDVSGGPVDTAPLTFTFAGQKVNAPQSQITADTTALTGTITMATTTQGVTGGATAVGILGNPVDTTLGDVPANIYFAGWFKTALLVGMDAGAIADLGAVVNSHFGWTHIG